MAQPSDPRTDRAIERFQLIAPLLAVGIDAAQAQQLKTEICAQTGWSERTLRRYLARYRTHGWEGLKPQPKGPRRQADVLSEAVLEAAIALRREVPRRSVHQLIQILEWEGRVAPGQLKRSTLQARLAERGYSARQLRWQQQSGVGARRFQRRHRNALWQSDIKYGPYLPIGPKGVKKQVYFIAFIDDATRFVIYAGFYPTMDQVMVEDAFRQAITAYGLPEAVYFDNGSQYKTHQMRRICTQLGIQLLFAKPYAPESKGKIERFNQSLDGFLAEVALEHPPTVDRLNALLQTWLSECYHSQPHTGLDPVRTPAMAYRSDPQAIRWAEPDQVTRAFHYAKTAKVNKVGCISFQGTPYEVGPAWAGQSVTVVYDPSDVSTVTIEVPGVTPWTARPLVIGEYTGKRSAKPVPHPPTPGHSRLLAAAQKRQAQRQARQGPTLAYRQVWADRTTPSTKEDPQHD